MSMALDSNDNSNAYLLILSGIIVMCVCILIRHWQTYLNDASLKNALDTNCCMWGSEMGTFRKYLNNLKRFKSLPRKWFNATMKSKMKNHVGSIRKSLLTSFETTNVRLFTWKKSCIIKLSCIWKVYEQNKYLPEWVR